MEREIKRQTVEFTNNKDMLENVQRELKQCKQRLDNALSTQDKHTNLSDEYRVQLVD